MATNKKRAKSRRPPQGRKAPEFQLLDALRAGIDSPTVGPRLGAIATLTVDDELRRRVRREIAERGHVLPRWLAELHHTRPVDRAVEVSTVFRDADELLVGVTMPDGRPLTAVVRIDNELG